MEDTTKNDNPESVNKDIQIKNVKSKEQEATGNCEIEKSKSDNSLGQDNTSNDKIPEVKDTGEINTEVNTEREVTADMGMNDGSTRQVTGDTVLVTGGCGFLGQHIVKMLQTKADHISHIIVLDLKPFEQKLEYTGEKPVVSLVGDICDTKFVNEATQGVDTVMHVAGVVDFGTFPDIDKMEKVNVKGTLNIVNACLKHNVSRLIYCSTVDVVVGNEPIRGGDEKNTSIPNNFLFPGYPDTKYHGERLVMGAAREKCNNGKSLQTVALRANVMYGELDPYYIPNGLKAAKRAKGILYQIGDGKSMLQVSYVGNTAWAFVCADSAMKTDPNLTAERFFIPDNTPVQNSFNFMRPYLECQGFRLSHQQLSYSLIYGSVYALEVLAKGISPIYKLELPSQSCSIAYLNMDIYFSGLKAKELLRFEPIYSPREARSASINYYSKLAI